MKVARAAWSLLPKVIISLILFMRIKCFFFKSSHFFFLKIIVYFYEYQDFHGLSK